jgi:RNA polymerase sigma factor (sigma-70 family)
MPHLRLQSRRKGLSPRDQRSFDLVRAIRRLPPNCRDVFVLYRFGGMSLEQVGNHLNIEPKKVETQLADALLHLGSGG